MTTLPMIEVDDDRPSLLIVDDDVTFCEVLAKAMTKRGFSVHCAHTVEQALELAETCMPEYATIDLRLPGTSGLVLVEKLKALDSGTRIVMLTGYASITTAVEAIKLGATHYLAKPVDADEIMAAFE
ncbi:MAG: response regulator, partial [Pseudomonadota bacterium]